MKSPIKVRLFFRRANPTGNVSIENSFEEMANNFPKNSRLELDFFRSSFYSIGFWQRFKAIFEVRKNQSQINHVTGDTNFFTLGLPKKKTVLTIHDCGFLDNKNPLAKWILKIFWLKLPVQNCQILTVVSQATKQDILKYTRCNPEKIVVIPTVIKSNFKHNFKAFSSSYPTLLHIGNSPNKNLERHAQAIAGLPCKFHVIGKINDDQISLIKHLNIDFKNSVNLTDEAMFEAYSEADILLFCSTIEGFGMPILEAQTVGRVVVTSNISAMPEVAGDGACFVDPLSTKAIRAGIEQVLSNKNYRNSLITNGLKNIERFSPKTVARQYEAVYETIFSMNQ